MKQRSIPYALATAALLAAGPVLAADMPPLAQKSGCTACHAIDRKVVGPAWLDVAKRYAGDAGAKDTLVNRVKTGGKGNWTEVTGGVPMPPYSPRVSDGDIAELVDFILGLAK